MFDRLKKLLFDESVELEPQEEFYEPLDDSLENNKNLIKTQPVKPVQLVKPVEVKEEVVIDEQPFKRIDLAVEPPKEEVKVEVPKEVVKAKPEVKKVVVKPKPRKKVTNPQYYKPRPVISPMFGVSQAENDRTQQIKELTKPEAPSEDDKIISPMYGVVTAEQEIVTKHNRPRPRRRRSSAVNISLEEMLNMPANDELEFTLFDVKVDRNEFQSREIKKVEDSKE